MTETLVGITAGAHLALGSAAVTHVDLDGHVDLARNPVKGGARVEEDQLTVSDAPGFGLELDEELLKQLAR